MTFVAFNWLDTSINVLLVVFVPLCLLMGLVILLQRPKQDGLGAAFGGAVTDQLFGARTTNVLQKATVYLGSLFFFLTIVLGILISKKNDKTSMVSDKVESAKVPEDINNVNNPVTEDKESMVGEVGDDKKKDEQPEQNTGATNENTNSNVEGNQPAEGDKVDKEKDSDKSE